MKLPKTLGACADQLYRLREQRLELQRQVAKLEEAEAAVREHLIAQLPHANATGVAGRLCRATVVMRLVPSVGDWDKLYRYVTKHQAFELLQRRVNEAAVKERWEAEGQLPGLTLINIPKVSLNKL